MAGEGRRRWDATFPGLPIMDFIRTWTAEAGVHVTTHALALMAEDIYGRATQRELPRETFEAIERELEAARH